MKIKWKKLIAIIIITFIIGSLFSIFTMNNMDTFKQLDKPINVPGFIFPIVWTILYLLMSISYYIVSEEKNTDDSTSFIYYAQLVVNSLWTLIFFGFKAYLLSFIWLLLLLGLIIIMLIKFYKINKVSCYLNIPYLIWVIFAGYLNLGIYLLNR